MAGSADPTPPNNRSAAARTREWIDVIGYGIGLLIRGAIPLGLGGLGGLEYFAPDVITSVTLSHDIASGLFYSAIGYFGFPMLSPGTRRDGGGATDAG